MINLKRIRKSVVVRRASEWMKRKVKCKSRFLKELREQRQAKEGGVFSWKKLR